MGKEPGNRGKKGELEVLKTVIKMEEADVIRDFRKPTYTNAPDDGVDLELQAPHNVGEIMESLKKGEEKTPDPLDTTISVRVDVKNYDGKISKPVMNKFINDTDKNPKDAEHWLVGGQDLTEGARKAMKNATNGVHRYYSHDDINNIDNTLSVRLENISKNTNTLESS